MKTEKIVFHLTLNFNELLIVFFIGCLLAAFVILGVLVVLEDIRYILMKRGKQDKVKHNQTFNKTKS